MSYTAIFSYLLLSGCAFWALSQCEGEALKEFWCCSNLGFSLICINGFLGLWHCSRNAGCLAACCNKICKKRSVISGLSFFTYIYSVPLIIVDLYLYYSFSYKIAYIHLFYPLLGFMPRLFGCNRKESVQMIDMIVLLHVGSLTTTCAMRHNYYGLGAGVVLAVSHFLVSAERKTVGLNSRTAQNYLMCAFLVLAFKALVEAEKDWVLNCSQVKDTLSAC